jgi:heme-degrading monooxygenase HmoA
MVVVLFESQPHPERKQAYMDAGVRLFPLAQQHPGFVALERYESFTTPGKLLELVTFRDEASVAEWRNQELHRRIQDASRNTVFADYRLRVASVVRDYGLHDRAAAPADSRAFHRA